ncbi:hypothetical protein [Thalassomonas haliotis]|uniref:Uncharacterized protein n=1 Tax=Thalassomonas haliotis TaxID=485448 RepID=A0ABY7VA84_9GAMM|nr:hypothetical protein [Thalassomonas haliotis]WDE10241.1 hypothetical protein H3N35_18415 [Thalassomonas haliotis]
MANPNDMPEFHSVKVSLTENIPSPQYPPPTHAATVARTGKRGNSGCASTCMRINLIGGRYHV